MITDSYAVLPDFLIVGAAKAGTTTIFDLLNKHPHLSLSKIKEPHYFSYPGENVQFKSIDGSEDDPKYITTLDDYCKLFPRNDRVMGEASTHYLYLHETTIPNIKSSYGSKYEQLKIIIVLRNPIERAWSHYGMKVRNGVENLSFQDAITKEVVKERLSKNCRPSYDYLGFSSYFSQVEAYKRAFPNTKLVLFEDFLKDKNLFLNHIFDFLNVEPFDVGTIRKLNISGVPTNGFTSFLKRIVFEKSVFKDRVKSIIPVEQRVNLKHALGKRILKKQNMPQEVKERLIEDFKTDTKRMEKKFSLDLSSWYG
jgi:hypothetical protein